MTSIRQFIDCINSRFPANDPARTVDTVKCGDPDMPVRGVIVTFMATRDVLQQAVALGANLVITHEPTFYNHADETDWLRNDPVYESKLAFIKASGLVLWRCHDGWHRRKPDGICEGMAAAFGWSGRELAGRPGRYEIAPVSLGDLARHCKAAVALAAARVAGDPSLACRRVALMPGACGGRPQIDALREPDIDVVICGESPEWETCEYVRDSSAAGRPKGLIVLGHANSEEAGMAWMVPWLRPLLPLDIPITHVPAGDPFRLV